MSKVPYHHGGRVGWSVAWFQLRPGRAYRAVFDRIAHEELRGMYYPLHEADESKFVEALSARLAQIDSSSPTCLKLRREMLGLAQAELAQRAQVGLRSIQMYEQRNKDLNRAQGAALYRLSRVLHCEMEDLLEK